MIRPILMMILMFASAVLHSQTFSVLHDHMARERPEIPYNVEHVESGFQVLIGAFSDSIPWELRQGVLLLDNEGNITNEMEHGVYGESWDVGGIDSGTLTSDGNICFSGSVAITGQENATNIYASLINETGTVSLSYVSDYDSEYVGRKCISVENGYVLFGYTSDVAPEDLGAVIIKLNSQMQHEWTQYVVSENDEIVISSAIQAHDGGFLLGGNVILGGTFDQCEQGEYDRDHILIKVDSLGNEEWQQNFGTCWIEGSAYIARASDGNYYYASFMRNEIPIEEGVHFGFAYLCKFDPQGDVIWEQTYGAQSNEVLLSKVIELSSGDLVACGYIWEYGVENWTRKGLIIKTDSEGDLIWEQKFEYEADVDAVFRDFIVLEDGGFVVVGLVHPWEDNPHQDSWILRLDECGCLEEGCNPDCYVGIDEQSAGKSLKLFPNPAQNEINLVLDHSEFHNAQIDVYDVCGQLVIEHQVATQTSSTFTLDISSLSSGTYCVRIQPEGDHPSTTTFMVGTN